MGLMLNATDATSSHVQASSGPKASASLCSWTNPGSYNLSVPFSALVPGPQVGEVNVGVLSRDLYYSDTYYLKFGQLWSSVCVTPYCIRKMHKGFLSCPGRANNTEEI